MANHAVTLALYVQKFKTYQCGQTRLSQVRAGEKHRNSGNRNTLQEGSCIGDRILQYWGCETPIKQFQKPASAGFLFVFSF
jgi:hypothetical protein